jgi:SSS family solute:Na+ symporter
MILIPGIAAFVPAYSLPNILFTGIFGFGLGIPAFVMMALGLFWKRNATAAAITMWVTFLASFVWEFTSLRAAVGLPGWFATPYMALILSLVLGLGLTAALGGKPGLVRKEATGAALGA